MTKDRLYLLAFVFCSIAIGWIILVQPPVESYTPVLIYTEARQKALAYEYELALLGPRLERADGLTIPVEVAQTLDERRMGLSSRASLDVDTGLLFIFAVDDQHGIWMKDMSFAIDIIWLDEYFRVTHISERATPESFPKVFRPKTAARYVLEVNAGMVEARGIDVGDEFMFLDE